MSKLFNENKQVINDVANGSSEYLRQIGLAAAEALSHMGVLKLDFWLL